MNSKTRRKRRRQAERLNAKLGIPNDNIDWYSISYHNPPKEESKPLVPGKDFYQETPEAQAKIDSNEWDTNLDEVIAFIKWATRPDSEIFDENGQYKPGESDWSWARNFDCKYVDLRIDMRDGGFVICAKGKRISLDKLKWQYKDE